jgi:phage terminase small subunit
MYKTLTTKQKRFVENYILKSMSIAESVRRAGYNVTSGRSEDYGSLGCRMLRTERVANYVSKLREKVFSKDALSLAEKRAYLARAVRTPVGEITEASDLAQEVTFSEGKEGSSRKVRAVDKLKAIELDSKISGDFYSDRNENITNPFLFLVSLGKQSVDVLQHGEVAQGEVRSERVALPSSAPATISVDAELVE